MKTTLVVNSPSNSAKVIASALGIKRTKPSRLALLSPRIVINWGVPSTTWNRRNRVINANSAQATNKAYAFNKLAQNEATAKYLPSTTTSWYEVQQSLEAGNIWLARTTVTGSGGAGITVLRRGDAIPAARLYVKYIKKSDEYRVHVVDGEAVFIQQKRKRNGAEQDRDQALIRNHGNGWVFCENELTFATPTTQEEIKQCATACVTGLGLDFGAVDLVVERGTNRVWFLEVNTRPGLESTRLVTSYAEAFRKLITKIRGR